MEETPEEIRTKIYEYFKTNTKNIKIIEPRKTLDNLLKSDAFKDMIAKLPGHYNIPTKNIEVTTNPDNQSVNVTITIPTYLDHIHIQY